MALKNNPVSRHAGFKYNEKGEKEKRTNKLEGNKKTERNHNFFIN
jgi:hypothetical protein